MIACPRLGVAATGSPFLRGNLPQGQVLEHLVSHHVLELGIFVLELLEPLGVVGIHAPALSIGTVAGIRRPRRSRVRHSPGDRGHSTSRVVACLVLAQWSNHDSQEPVSWP